MSTDSPYESQRLVLQQRLHDSQRDTWTPWEEISLPKLLTYYGQTPEEWKTACRDWIGMGGRYEYRIVRRSEVQEWGLSFEDKQS